MAEPDSDGRRDDPVAPLDASPSGEGGTAPDVRGHLFADFLSTMKVGSRRKGGDGVEEGTASRIVGAAVFTSLLAAGAEVAPLTALDRLFTRVFKTRAASSDQKAWIRLLVQQLLDDEYGREQVRYVRGLEHYNPDPALRLLRETRAAMAGTADAKAVAALQIAFGTALQLVGRHKQVRNADTITCAVFANFADYFRRVAWVIGVCDREMKLRIELKMSYLGYEELYAAAREPSPRYDMILLDDPWLAEYMARHRGNVKEPIQFSAHVMVFCFNRRFGQGIRETLGESRALTRADLMRVANGFGPVLIPEADVQKPYSIARQVCHAGNNRRPRPVDLRDGYAELRGTAGAAAAVPLSQSAALDLIGAGEAPLCAPVFLGHAVAESPYAGAFDFVPFAGGGVSGNWYIAAAGRNREAAAALAEVFAAPLDEGATIGHGIVPPERDLGGLRGPEAIAFLERKLDAKRELLYGPSFQRFDEEHSFLQEAARFNAAACG